MQLAQASSQIALEGGQVGRSHQRPHSSKPDGTANGTEEDKAAIQKNAEAFIEAFQKGDAKALAGSWTPDGDYTTLTGRHMKGRGEIEKAFNEFFKQNKDLKLGVDSDSLRFVTPDVAIEDGTTAVATAVRPPAMSRTAVARRPTCGEGVGSVMCLASTRHAAWSTQQSDNEPILPLMGVFVVRVAPHPG